MSPMTLSQVLARANASLVESDFDVTGALASLLSGAAEALPAQAAAVLVDVDGTLEVLASTTHRVHDLEVYQRQVDEGPCLDAIRTGEPVREVGREALTERWPKAGPAIEQAGYLAVQGTPLRWHGADFGALNLFRSAPEDFGDDEQACRAVADMVTLVLVAAQPHPPQLAEGLHAALAERAVVEQAKGALAYTRSIDMGSAFDALVALADAEQVTLGVAARRVMERARTNRLGTR